MRPMADARNTACGMGVRPDCSTHASEPSAGRHGRGRGMAGIRINGSCVSMLMHGILRQALRLSNTSHCGPAQQPSLAVQQQQQQQLTQVGEGLVKRSGLSARGPAHNQHHQHLAAQPLQWRPGAAAGRAQGQASIQPAVCFCRRPSTVTLQCQQRSAHSSQSALPHSTPTRVRCQAETAAAAG